jgi:hypothetical protein
VGGESVEGSSWKAVEVSPDFQKFPTTTKVSVGIGASGPRVNVFGDGFRFEALN